MAGNYLLLVRSQVNLGRVLPVAVVAAGSVIMTIGVLVAAFFGSHDRIQLAVIIGGPGFVLICLGQALRARASHKRQR